MKATGSQGEPSQVGSNFPRLISIMRQLLAPGGCPWDRAQTHESLKPYVLEEACEVMDAIDRNEPQALQEELGDLLLQVVFHAELSRREGPFGIDDVVNGICEKLERRHPHVFGEVQGEGLEQVRHNWERIKAEEKQGRGVLEGIPKSLPALAQAQRMGEKAARVGFDWPDRSGCRAKIDEELSELDAAITSDDTNAIKEEIGDLLFSIVNLSRHLGLDAEQSLRATSSKFSRRFSEVERKIIERHGGFKEGQGHLPIETLEGYWKDAKQQESR